MGEYNNNLCTQNLVKSKKKHGSILLKTNDSFVFVFKRFYLRTHSYHKFTNGVK